MCSTNHKKTLLRIQLEYRVINEGSLLGAADSTSAGLEVMDPWGEIPVNGFLTVTGFFLLKMDFLRASLASVSSSMLHDPTTALPGESRDDSMCG